ncbi:IreB family regulatory phosphoprotein [Anaerofustis butyriciformans]|uniref:IreB family regulatory phosphoprotein n=1 Tax=Anaerofustis TaxID=264995 RepID=UPI003F8AA2AD
MGTNNSNSNFTMQFSLENDRSKLIEETLRKVETALEEKGYNPVNQLVGYIMSGDPTYITSYKDARKLIRQVERDEILELIVLKYFNDLK